MEDPQPPAVDRVEVTWASATGALSPTRGMNPFSSTRQGKKTLRDEMDEEEDAGSISNLGLFGGGGGNPRDKGKGPEIMDSENTQRKPEGSRGEGDPENKSERTERPDRPDTPNPEEEGRPEGPGGPGDPDDPDGPGGGPGGPNGPPRRPKRPWTQYSESDDNSRRIDIPKPKKPDSFTGEREKWPTFLIQVLLYMEHYQEYFRDNKRKSIQVLNWFEGPIVRPWADQLIVAGLERERTTLDDFEGLLRTAGELWGPINMKETAQQRIEELSQKKTVSEYHAQFIAHASHTEYNEVALEKKFYDGLKPAIKDMFVHDKRDGNMRNTLKKALDFEARILARMEERKREGTSGKSWGGNPQGRGTQTAKAGRLTEDERKKRMKEGRCFNCNQIGHLANKCPRKGQAKKGEVKEEPKKDDEGEEEEEEKDFMNA